MYRVGEPGPPEGPLQQDAIVGVVFHDENGLLCQGHDHPAFVSSNQNLLPDPVSDSTPTWPPMRSTPLRTMARPTPVPG